MGLNTAQTFILNTAPTPIVNATPTVIVNCKERKPKTCEKYALLDGVESEVKISLNNLIGLPLKS